MAESKTFRLTQNHRATRDGNFGAVHTVDTDTVMERDGGVQVDTHTTGTIEGTRIDRRESKFYPGVTLEKAAAYRRRVGYVELSGRSSEGGFATVGAMAAIATLGAVAWFGRGLLGRRGRS